MSQFKVRYEPPRGYPLGTNLTFKICANLIIPIFNLFMSRDWKGAENIPSKGRVIVASNHMSYLDVLVFTHFLFRNGRAPRYLGKAGVFKVPIIGKIILAAGQVPVERESADAKKAVDHAKIILEQGHMLGVYPEGTLTRDPDMWPMIAKTGCARLALQTDTPVIPIAQWGLNLLFLTTQRSSISFLAKQSSSALENLLISRHGKARVKIPRRSLKRPLQSCARLLIYSKRFVARSALK
jgi:1-acyl-sn-glycerol-3-phosphate acyltransferase